MSVAHESFACFFRPCLVKLLAITWAVRRTPTDFTALEADETKNSNNKTSKKPRRAGQSSLTPALRKRRKDDVTSKIYGNEVVSRDLREAVEYGVRLYKILRDRASPEDRSKEANIQSTTSNNKHINRTQ